MASCCNGKRFAGSGAGVIPSQQIRVQLAALPEEIASQSPAVSGSSNFGLMVGAGVTIWGITKFLEKFLK